MDDRLAGMLRDLTGGDEAVAEAAAVALSSQPGALGPLIALLGDPSHESRWWAVRALATFPEPAAIRAVESALADPDLAVRQCALRALLEHPAPDLVPSLIPRLADPDSISARLAGEVLLRIGAEALPELVRVLETGSPGARTEAARTLAHMKDPHAIGPLFRALADESALVCHWAEEGLERLGQDYVFFSP